MLMVTRTFHEAGIPIVVGTDSGSWPHFLNLFHGPTTLREMELLVEAGMKPNEVIASATRIPAEMMGIEDEVGTIEIGKRADLLILAGDPLEDISTLKTLLWVIKNGEARSPEDWLYAPPDMKTGKSR
jgi:imidazolonepropionase-like amidohydrolase